MQAPDPNTAPRIRVGALILDREALYRALTRYAAGSIPTIAILAAEIGVSPSTAQRLVNARQAIPGAPNALLEACRVRASANRGRAGTSRRLLTAEQVVALRAARARGAAVGALAREHGLSRSLLRHLLAGRTYAATKTNGEGAAR